MLSQLDYLGVAFVAFSGVLWHHVAVVDGRHVLSYRAWLWALTAATWTGICRYVLHHSPAGLVVDQLAIVAAMVAAIVLHERGRSRA